MTATADIKRRAAELVKTGDAAGLKRLFDTVVESHRGIVASAEWRRVRQAKIKLMEEKNHAIEAEKIKVLDGEAKELKSVLDELKVQLPAVEASAFKAIKEANKPKPKPKPAAPAKPAPKQAPQKPAEAPKK